ncbi:DHA2 family efflux MFS transporter permease subunit [Deinococcus koreensis]|uniref:MFS transporter n=1 Tax=Deinococcus koreensis TaxID=2054903 RepID=A0A2K3UTL0_9DEIO|nr:DHA2 family efflux MFS transporter permease subunit [Deinococcus koreensis]PNY79875.1 MFS transporter [Deinococcus koreensis]
MTTTPSAPEALPAILSPQARARIMVGVVLAVLLASLDQTIVAAAGPRIQQALSVTPALYAWLTIAYLVTSTVTLPVAGKLGDLYGRRPVMLGGIAVFVLGSLLCGLAWNAGALILFRALQGLGAGALLAGTGATVADLYPPLERARVQGLLGAVIGVSSILGPLVGGALTDALSWPWVFFVNVPLGLLALWVIWARLPGRATAPWRGPVDVPGALLLTLAVVSLLLALSLGKTAPAPGELAFAWTSWPILTLLTTFAAALVAFLHVERRAADPLLDLRLFRDRTFALGVSAVFVLGASLLTTGVFLPLFLINVVGVSATAAGLSTTPLMFALIASSILSGLLTTRLGRYKSVMLGGLAVLFVGFVLLGFTLSPQSSALEVSLKMIVVGIGFGPVVSLYTLAVQNALPPAQTGVATSSVGFFQQLGGSAGLAVLGAVFAASLSANLPDLPTDGAAVREAYTSAVSTVFRLGALIVVLGAAVTVFLPGRPLRAGAALPQAPVP